LKTGDLVRSTTPNNSKEWVGIIVDWDNSDPIVFWDENFPDEVEYTHQLEVINESN
jgi:hypothetical protein